MNPTEKTAVLIIFKSAESMEKEAAVEMFKRSIPLYNLKYTTYVGDGDSSSYGEVCDAMFKKYGDEYIVVKEDCVGHIQKRMGTNLRTLKKNSKGKNYLMDSLLEGVED